METVERLGGEDEGGGAGPSTPTQLTPPPSLLIRIRLSAMAAASADFMVEDLKKEREGSKLNNQELTHFLDGGEWMTEKRRKIYELIRSNPVFSCADKYYLTREEALDRAMEKSIEYIKVCRERDLDRLDKNLLKNGMNEELPTGINESMFLPTLEGQGSDEQKEKWLSLAREFKIIGAYAQTELGHGSNVRGLETTATYDEKTQEFVVDTPTLTATKFWPGTLGHSATHAVVMARLITKGVDRGIHPFIVQIRSLQDHTPLPGISVGDIGPKMGYFGMDNGFLALDHVRIPRDHMLMKYSQVKPNGTYLKPPSEKIAYGTMVMIRVSLVWYLARVGLAKAVTIATRYSAVRRQGQIENNGPEVQVLDYQTQQLQLFPLLAASYALVLAGQALLRQYVTTQGEIEQGNFAHMQELHATACGMKAFGTELCTQGMETCRQACGGHGYLRACGIPDIYVDLVPGVTYEGVNTVMYLQTGRYFNKMVVSKQLSSQLPENISYLGYDFKLRPCPVRTPQHFMDPAVQLSIYEQRAHRMVDLAVKTYQQGLGRGLKSADAWNLSTCDWVAAVKAHCYYMTLKNFRESINYSDLSPSNLEAVNALCGVFATHGIVTRAGEFMTGGYMSSDQVSMCREQLYSLLKMVRREAVALVDAFDIPDHVLNSVLGRHDGDVYTHLLNWAKKAPRNKKPVHDVYKKHLKPLLQSKL